MLNPDGRGRPLIDAGYAECADDLLSRRCCVQENLLNRMIHGALAKLDGLSTFKYGCCVLWMNREKSYAAK